MKKKNQSKFQRSEISKAQLAQIAGGSTPIDTGLITGGVEPNGRIWRDYVPEQASAAV